MSKNELGSRWNWDSLITHRIVTLGKGAVCLVYDDGIVDILHHKVVKGHVLNLSNGRWIGPCLDPYSIRRPLKGAILYDNILHIFFIIVPPQASNTVVIATTINKKEIYIKKERNDKLDM